MCWVVLRYIGPKINSKIRITLTLEPNPINRSKKLKVKKTLGCLKDSQKKRLKQ
jgi:hypothetical protein